MELKKCLQCGEPVKGRIDKKFCDDQCRTAYNNRLNSGGSVLVRNINNALKKNRKIMQELLADAPDGKSKVTHQRMLDKGYHFSYHTHLYKTSTGTEYTFCYEYGYLPLGNNYYMLVKKTER